ncbi:abasic site processing protein HMCES isoform X3 [Nymphalis io]|uniref:abasic site processing protein HMCES isoform X3 n=1 Tax=Inachis io TaxID=171585 RepID=UPI002169AEA7|nr:abasic site processing protein HMCES isoform X3 [Nymphalis io]
MVENDFYLVKKPRTKPYIMQIVVTMATLYVHFDKLSRSQSRFHGPLVYLFLCLRARAIGLFRVGSTGPRSLNKEQVRCACSYKQKNGNTYIKPDWLHEHNDGKEYLPSYNIAPSDVTPVLIAGNRNEGISKTSRVLKPMMWGIIPPWHKVDDPETWNNEFNETDGWKGIKLLHMAGLYHAWQHEGTIVYSYSVITMESNDTLNWLHHRMPAILDSQEQIDAWLDIHSVNSELALSYLRSVKILSWHQVSKEVNNSRYKSSNCNKRVTTEKKSKQKTLTSFFTKTEKRKYNDEDNIINEECKKIKS